MQTQDVSNSAFGRWSRKNNIPTWGNDETHKKYEIKQVLRKREVTKEICDTYTKVGSDRILFETVFDNYRRIDNKGWAPRKWMSNRDFSNVCNVLGNATKMTNTRFCMDCGKRNSVMHAIHDCEKFDNLSYSLLKIDIVKMFGDKCGCEIECNKLNKLLLLHKRNWKMPELSSTVCTIFENRAESDILVVAPLRQDVDTFRVKYLVSGLVISMNLKELWKRGDLIVRTPVNLEWYLKDRE